MQGRVGWAINTSLVEISCREKDLHWPKAIKPFIARCASGASHCGGAFAQLGASVVLHWGFLHQLSYLLCGFFLSDLCLIYWSI